MGFNIKNNIAHKRRERENYIYVYIDDSKKGKKQTNIYVISRVKRKQSACLTEEISPSEDKSRVVVTTSPSIKRERGISFVLLIAKLSGEC